MFYAGFFLFSVSQAPCDRVCNELVVFYALRGGRSPNSSVLNSGEKVSTDRKMQRRKAKRMSKRQERTMVKLSQSGPTNVDSAYLSA